jgi:hypothetical protein
MRATFMAHGIELDFIIKSRNCACLNVVKHYDTNTYGGVEGLLHYS